jgi:hypothetical protein
MDSPKIVKRYLTSNFILDLGIVLADWIPLAMGAFGMGGQTDVTKNMRLLRVFRLARFFRLLRLKKLRSIIQSMEDTIDNAYLYVTLSVMKNLFSILAVNHALACLWYWIGCLEIDGSDSWVRDEHNDVHFESRDWLYKYVTCLLWAITQFTPGSISVYPANSVERLFMVVVLLFALIVFSAFVSDLTHARIELQKLTGKLGKECWMLRKYFRQQGVSRDLTFRVQAYIHKAIMPKIARVKEHDVDLLQWLSEPLRTEIQAEIYSRSIRVYPLFDWISRRNMGAMQEICCVALRVVEYGQHDLVFNSGQTAQHMYIVSNGSFVYAPRHPDLDVEIQETDTWCCEMVLWVPWLHRGRWQAHSISELLLIDESQFRKALTKNQDVCLVAQRYAKDYLRELNSLAEADKPLSDIFVLEIRAVGRMALRSPSQSSA